MSYFSRIRLDTAHPDAGAAVQQLLRDDAYEDHRLLWQFFPASPGIERDFVFRRMEGADGNAASLFYAVSGRQPQSPHPAWLVESKPYEPELRAGQELAFELRINPVQSRKRDDGGARRDDVVMHAKHQFAQRAGYDAWRDIPQNQRPQPYELIHEAVSNWFCGDEANGSIAARNGFFARPAQLHVNGYRQHRMRRKQTDIRVSTVDISGLLTVRDPELFVAALRNGIGKAKAFGCGLMLVRRP